MSSEPEYELFFEPEALVWKNASGEDVLRCANPVDLGDSA